MKKYDSCLTGIPTGFYDLDYRIDGLQKGKLILLTGEDEKKKTILARNIAEFVKEREKLPVVYVDDSQDITISRIRERIFELEPEERQKLIVVENMEKLICEECKDGPEKYNTIAKALKEMAIEFDSPVLAVADEGTDTAKQYADLRIQICVEEKEGEKESEDANCKLVITKYPGEKAGAVQLLFQKEHSWFVNKGR